MRCILAYFQDISNGKSKGAEKNSYEIVSRISGWGWFNTVCVCVRERERKRE